MSRSRTRERRQQREHERKRQQRMVLIGVVAAVAVILVVFLIIAQTPAEATIPAEAVEQYAGLPQSVTDEGYPVLGDPDAPVSVVEYSSFDCPHCKDFYKEVTPFMIDRVEKGEINFTYIPLFGTGGIVNGEGAAKAALCASEQDAFWTYHSALFTWQDQYANTAFTQGRLTGGVDNLGIDRAQWDSCFGSNRPDEILTAASESAQSLEGFTGTPTVLVNGEIVSPTLAAVNTAIDAALAASPIEPSPLDRDAEVATEEATVEASEAEETPAVEAVEEATVEASEAEETPTVEAVEEATAEATEASE